MNIHEYQAKAILREYGVPVAKGAVAFTPEEAMRAAEALPGPVWVVKAQIHAGGRGKGKFKEPEAGEKGGVRLAKSVDDVGRFAKEMLGHTLVTLQTGPDGKAVKRLYIEDGSPIKRELVSISAGRPLHLAPRLHLLDRRRYEYRGRRAQHAREDCHADHRSGVRIFAVPWPQGCIRARTRRQPGEAMRQADRRSRAGGDREGHRAARDQSADRHRSGRPALPRCQGEFRRQRPVPTSRCRGAARPRRGRSGGSRGIQIRPLLRQARRQRSAVW